MAAKYDTEGSNIGVFDEEDHDVDETRSTSSSNNEDMNAWRGLDLHVNPDLQCEIDAKKPADAALFSEDTDQTNKRSFRRVFSQISDTRESFDVDISSSRSCPDLRDIPVDENCGQRSSAMSKIRKRFSRSMKSRTRCHRLEEADLGAAKHPCVRKRSRTTTDVELVQISSHEQSNDPCHAKNVSVVKRKSSLLDKFRKWLLDDFGIKERMNSSSDENLNGADLEAQEDLDCYLAPDLLEIANCPFYWGDINRHEAEEYLHSLPEGTFLLRDSAQKDFLFSVSFRRYGRTFHARLHQSNHRYTFDSEESAAYTSPNVLGLLARYSKAEFCMYFEPLLLMSFPRPYPFSLQDMCRASVCDRVAYQHVRTLPIPKGLQDYLREYYYKTKQKKNHKGDSDSRGKDTKTSKRFSCR